MEINEIELACNLAHNSMYDEVTREEWDGEEILSEEDLYEFENADTSKYKEEIQEVFNRWYDYYLGEIEKCKV
jgi:hypothetical protein